MCLLIHEQIHDYFASFFFAFQILDVLLKFQYSGGPGYVDQYCRQCSLALTVEILPSLVFNKWNVLAEEK